MAKSKRRLACEKVLAEGQAKIASADEQSKQLISLLRCIVEKPDSARVDAWGDQADEIIEGCVRAENDAVLETAVDALRWEGRLDAAEELESAIEVAACMTYHQVGDIEACLSLFAIPVILLATNPVGAAGQTALGERPLQRLIASIQEHGLLDSEPRLFLMPHLYSHEEIRALPPSKLAKLGARMIAHLDGERRCADAELGICRTVKDPIEAKGGTLDGVLTYSLGYLIGGVIGDDFLTPGEVRYTDDGYRKAQQEMDMKSAKWTEVASEMLREALGGEASGIESTMVGGPDTAISAFRQGETDYQNSRFQVEITDTMEKRGLDGEDSAALLAFGLNADEQSAEIRMSLLSKEDNSLVGGFLRPLLAHERPEDVGEDIVDIIQALGVRQFNFVPGMQEFTSCECCGEPNFLVPGIDDEVETAAMGHHRGSRTLH